MTVGVELGTEKIPHHKSHLAWDVFCGEFQKQTNANDVVRNFTKYLITFLSLFHALPLQELLNIMSLMDHAFFCVCLSPKRVRYDTQLCIIVHFIGLHLHAYIRARRTHPKLAKSFEIHFECEQFGVSSLAIGARIHIVTVE